MTWNPNMDEAPRDGTPFLGWFPKYNTWDVVVCQKTEYWEGVQVIEFVDQWNNEPFELGDGTKSDPTHWMPLPEPPEE